MSKSSRISAIYDLGQFFNFFVQNEIDDFNSTINFNELKPVFEQKIRMAEIHNPWFTLENIQFALKQWANVLTLENLNQWTENHSYAVNPKKIGIIMAGNIPLVGFHDLISVLVSGHSAVVKTSSKDDVLMDFVIDFLQSKDQNLKQDLIKAERLQDHQAVIATGSNNTARYFEYYFKDLPHIIRKNRTSVAVLNGKESIEDLKNLAQDIFSYFGLGCRNVTKLYLPEGYNTDLLFEAFYDWNPIINHTKYANNYDYNRAIYLMEQQAFLDNNFVILKESTDLHSPIGVLHFEFYKDFDGMVQSLENRKEEIQCRVGKDFEIHFGQTQSPKLNDYADGVDVLEFLEKLN